MCSLMLLYCRLGLKYKHRLFNTWMCLQKVPYILYETDANLLLAQTTTNFEAFIFMLANRCPTKNYSYNLGHTSVLAQDSRGCYSENVQMKYC